MLYGRGAVWLNGKPLPRSSAVFPGDLIQTQPESLATLDASGSGVIVLPDSLVKFESERGVSRAWKRQRGHFSRYGCSGERGHGDSRFEYVDRI